jgi:hypothetical protein
MCGPGQLPGNAVISLFSLHEYSHSALRKTTEALIQQPVRFVKKQRIKALSRDRKKFA